MRQSGLDHYLRDRSNDASFVYGGFSAGACVAGPTLRGVELVHRDSPHIERMVEYYIENEIPFVALRDGEVLVTSRCSPVMRSTTRATRTTHRSLTFESPQRQKHIRGGLMLRGFREEADTLEIQGEVSQLFSALWQPL